jgi:hypothetical protein
MATGRIKQYVFGTSWLKTLWINFHYFPKKHAVKLPIFVAKRSVFRELRGGGKNRRPYIDGNVVIWIS